MASPGAVCTARYDDDLKAMRAMLEPHGLADRFESFLLLTPKQQAINIRLTETHIIMTSGRAHELGRVSKKDAKVYFDHMTAMIKFSGSYIIKTKCAAYYDQITKIAKIRNGMNRDLDGSSGVPLVRLLDGSTAWIAAIENYLDAIKPYRMAA